VYSRSALFAAEGFEHPSVDRHPLAKDIEVSVVGTHLEIRRIVPPPLIQNLALGLRSTAELTRYAIQQGITGG
jgi:hypothetical protein